jgi:AraC family transcriptional regulator
MTAPDRRSKAYDYSDVGSAAPITRREAMRRINRSIDYLDSRIAEPLNLDTLAAQAHFSRNHFMRVFAQLTGETPVEHLRRIRLERAAVLLNVKPNASILEIALDVGFRSAAVFARAFSAHFGRSASAWRRGGFWRRCGMFACWRPLPCNECETPVGTHAVFERARENITQIRWEDSQSPPSGIEEIRLETWPTQHIAYMRGIGPFQANVAGLRSHLRKWALVNHLWKPETRTYFAFLDMPGFTAPRHYRYDAGIFVPENFVPDRYVNAREVLGGRFAVAHCRIRVPEMVTVNRYLWNDWLPARGLRPIGRPSCNISRVGDNPHVMEYPPQHAVIMKICVPVVAIDTAEAPTER